MIAAASTYLLARLYGAASLVWCPLPRPGAGVVHSVSAGPLAGAIADDVAIVCLPGWQLLP